MSNKAQKRQEAQKRFFIKVMLIPFYFLMICYGQCGYAVIEKYLTPGPGKPYKFCVEGSRITINTMELAIEVATYLKNGRLSEVYIRLPEPGGDQDNIRQLILEALSEALRNNTALTTLDLGSNQIGVEGTRTLAGVIRNNTTLTTLYLRNNQLGAEGARVLAEALRNNTALTMLDLQYNQIGDEGTGALAEALRNNTTLMMLFIGYNQIGDAGAQALAEALRNNTALTTLDLGGNRIGVEGARALAEVLTDNFALLNIYSDDGYANDKPLLRNNLLIKLLRKIKRASSFTFAVGLHHAPLRYVTQAILSAAGLNVRNRTAFENIQNYNTEWIRDIIFKGSLEEVMRLFYYGSDSDYGEILREINEIRRLQIEILHENQRAIPQGLVELPEELPMGTVLNMTQEEQIQKRRDFVTTAFWTS